MDDKRTKLIRKAAKELLSEGKVEVVIGFERGTLPGRSIPAFIRAVEDVDRLIWDSACENNLATFITKVKGPVAIVVKGCDSRSVVNHLKENQIKREDIVVIGVPCEGMIDRKKIDKLLGDRELLEFKEEDDKITLKGDGFEEVVSKEELLPEFCQLCRHRNPVLYDILIGEKVPEQTDVNFYSVIDEFEEKTPEERWEYLNSEFSRCIRCYACIKACPLCYCDTCFVDRSDPVWVGKTTNLSELESMHIIRALHMAGRCVDCGACARACPMDIDIRKLTKKLERDVLELWGYDAGVDVEETPPLATFNPNDPQEFIM